MLENTTIVIAALLCFLLLIIGALIFDQKFRTDVLQGTGTAKILGILSVEGVVVVLIMGILCGLLGFTLNLHSNDRDTPALFSDGNPFAGDPDVEENFGKLVKAEEAFCMLSKIGGRFSGDTHSVELSIDDGGYWVLEKTNPSNTVVAEATCFKYKTESN